jgi:hypothetical protein
MKATPHEQRLAQLVAQMMRNYDDLWQRAEGATGSESDWERFREKMAEHASIIELHINFFGNRARFLRLVAWVLDGKTLRGAPHDEVVKKAANKAIKKAIEKRRRKNHKTGRSGLDISDLCPPFPEIEGAYWTLAKAIPKGLRLTERQVRRRAEALGYIQPKKSPRLSD